MHNVASLQQSLFEKNPYVTQSVMSSGPTMRYRNGITIQLGWFPWVIEILAVTALAYVICGSGRTRRWWQVSMPFAFLAAAIAIWASWSYIDKNGLAGDPAPSALWFWIGATAVALISLVVGWRGQRAGKRFLAFLAVPLCLLSTGIVVNQWVGYYRTLEQAWDEFTAGPLENEIALKDLPTLQGSAQKVGHIVAVDIPNSASGFSHRKEYVYLPPAWFASPHPPSLPVVMMIGGEFDTPSHWIRVGGAADTADAFASEHQGNTPILVFVDTSGSFNTDSECVNGPRGQSEDHLVKDVPPYLVSQFHADPHPHKWGVAGWSMGGTCAVNLAVRHPDHFSAFLDIAGDLRPSAGDEKTTIENLFGGDEAAYQAHAPVNAIKAHGRYEHSAGWFQTSASPTKPRQVSTQPFNPSGGGNIGFGGFDPGGFAGSGDYTGAARTICQTARLHNIDCSVIVKPGRHTWQFAADAFGEALPWLAGYLGTPTVSPSLLPETTPAD